MMSRGLTEEDLRLLRKIAGRGGERVSVPLSSVVTEGDRVGREALERLQRGGYVRVQAPKAPAAPLYDELDALSYGYLKAMRALARCGSREEMARALESARSLGDVLRCFEEKRARRGKVLEQLDFSVEELVARRRVGELSELEYRLRLSALDLRRERLRPIAADRQVEHRLQASRALLKRLRREGRLTPQQLRELSPQG